MDDGYIGELADAVTGSLGGKVGVAPRVYLKKLVADVLDRVDQFPDLGADPPVALTQRAKKVLAEVRDEHVAAVHPGGTVITRDGDDVHWWTWAGYRANATLAATLSHLTDSVQRFDDASIRMRSDLGLEIWKAGTADAAERLCLPDVDQRALEGLKFNEALPERLATAPRNPSGRSGRRCPNAR